MARFTFRLPDIGEGIAEAEIVAWHVAVGDAVKEDDRLVDMMTDKATVEMESPVTGTVIEVAGEVGDVIAIGSPLVVIDTDGGQDEPPGDKSAAVERSGETEDPAAGIDAAATLPAVPASAPTSPSTRDEPSPAGPEPAARPSPPVSPPERAPTPAEPADVPAARRGRPQVLASPAVRQRARSLGIDLAQIRPSAAGRIRHADLEQFIAYHAGAGYAPAGSTGDDQQIKVVGLRRRIAENMAAAKRNIPHFSYVEECDVTALETMRAQLNEERAERPKLTMLPLLITAICRAVPKFTMINARYDDEAGVVTRHGAVHLGIATQTPAGLMVPVIRDAQRRNLWQLAAEIVRLAGAARDGSVRAEELTGSTLTISSLGPLGGVASTPVINRPEVAIIAPNRIVERPMFVPDGLGGERVDKRKLMNLSISCDHRVVDGWDAASFIQEVKRLIERPVLLLTS